jgi:hypothetical protein
MSARLRAGSLLVENGGCLYDPAFAFSGSLVRPSCRKPAAFDEKGMAWEFMGGNGNIALKKQAVGDQMVNASRN